MGLEISGQLLTYIGMALIAVGVIGTFVSSAVFKSKKKRTLENLSKEL